VWEGEEGLSREREVAIGDGLAGVLQICEIVATPNGGEWESVTFCRDEDSAKFVAYDRVGEHTFRTDQKAMEKIVSDGGKGQCVLINGLPPAESLG
jgi:hypothetical protein